MSRKLLGLYCLGALIVLMSFVPSLQSQTTFGSVVGTVADASGAAMAGTQVVLTNIGTNEKRTQTTNEEGLYQFLSIAPGQYSAEVSKPGFKRVLRSPITVETESLPSESTSACNLAMCRKPSRSPRKLPCCRLKVRP